MLSSTLALFVLAVASVTCAKLESRMYNGEQIGSNEFQFLVELKLNYNTGKTFTCSGSIVNANWIITAAHCVSFPGAVTNIRVTRVGNRPVTPIIISGSNIRKHPNFMSSADGLTVSSASVKVDLAFLRTPQPIQFNQFIQAVPLGRMPPQGEAVVAGYGQPENQPRKGRMMLAICPGHLLCSKRSGFVPKTGHGDSGGPVVANGVLVGVVSGEMGETDVFADVASNYDWIQSVINM